MSIKSFIRSEPAQMAMLIITVCAVINGATAVATTAADYVRSINTNYLNNRLADIDESIYDTKDINRKLELMNILRDACIDNPGWQDLDENDPSKLTCTWVMGTDI